MAARGMREMGFKVYRPPERQEYIITSFRHRADPGFDFDEFYRRLADRGMTIHPGKVSDVDCFRIGTIGRRFEADIEALVSVTREVPAELHVASARAS